jgi:hypothetical protein
MLLFYLKVIISLKNFDYPKEIFDMEFLKVFQKEDFDVLMQIIYLIT